MTKGTVTTISTAVLLIILALTLLLSGCTSLWNEQEQNPVNYDNLIKNIKTVNIEGCEYLVYSAAHMHRGWGFMAHKGNCHNPIHKQGCQQGDVSMNIPAPSITDTTTPLKMN